MRTQRWTRRTLSLVAVVGVLGAAGCGGSGKATYPTVIVPPLKLGPPTTTPGGAVVRFHQNPRVYSIEPSAGCEWVAYEQPGSSKRLGPISLQPPAPGLRAEAVSTRKARLEYSFRTLPRGCRPKYITLGIVGSGAVGVLPIVEQLPIDGTSGEATLTYPSIYPPPDVAFANSSLGDGSHGRTVEVLIRR